MASRSGKTLRIPTSAHVQIVQDAPDRLVVHIPSGGPRAVGLGCFAIFVNGFMIVATLVVTAIAFQDKAAPLWFIGPILALFWAIGLGLAYAWVRMRFTRQNLLVEPDRAVVESTFFGRRSLAETGIDASCTVDLVEMYQVNNAPVHAIAVSGVDRTIKFGTSLSDQEKRFLLHKIRLVTRLEERTEEEWQKFLREFPGNCVTCGATLPAPERHAAFVTCEHCGRTHAGSVVGEREVEEDTLPFEDLEPVQLPPQSLVRVDDSNPQCLELRYAACDPRFRWQVAGCCSFLSLFVAMFLVVGFNILVMAIVGAPSPTVQIAGTLLLGIGIPVLVVAALVRSEVHVVLDRENLLGVWKVGPLRIKRALAVHDIRQVVLTTRRDDEEPSHSSSRRTSQDRPRNDWVTCVVASSTARIPAASLDLATARQIAGLIRGRLRKMGCEV